ncbi:GNAT family N-acetyltransferase [uncultured Methanobrevibacter sp.]|uniref:GNAT family N-acetyltransferase n=1 Tax=uncultured Methanobrevibacter sp. TaxID=253161 RepID=UPI002624C6F7
MSFLIKEISDDDETKIKIRNFLFSQIRSEYGYGYVPSYHKDIIDLNKYYIDSSKNNLFFIENDYNKIIATIAVRPYDKDFAKFKNLYNKESTASIWRLFVDKPYRRCGFASKLYNIVERFCCENDFKEIYLHTHKNLEAGFHFWKKQGFQVTWDTNNNLQTVHMIKNLNSKICD